MENFQKDNQRRLGFLSLKKKLLGRFDSFRPVRPGPAALALLPQGASAARPSPAACARKRR